MRNVKIERERLIDRKEGEIKEIFMFFTRMNWMKKKNINDIKATKSQ